MLKKIILVSLAEVNNKCMCRVDHINKGKLYKSILKASVVTMCWTKYSADDSNLMQYFGHLSCFIILSIDPF